MLHEGNVGTGGVQKSLGTLLGDDGGQAEGIQIEAVLQRARQNVWEDIDSPASVNCSKSEIPLDGQLGEALEQEENLRVFRTSPIYDRNVRAVVQDKNNVAVLKSWTQLLHGCDRRVEFCHGNPLARARKKAYCHEVLPPNTCRRSSGKHRRRNVRKGDRRHPLDNEPESLRGRVGSHDEGGANRTPMLRPIPGLQMFEPERNLVLETRLEPRRAASLRSRAERSRIDDRTHERAGRGKD